MVTIHVHAFWLQYDIIFRNQITVCVELWNFLLTPFIMWKNSEPTPLTFCKIWNQKYVVTTCYTHTHYIIRCEVPHTLNSQWIEWVMHGPRSQAVISDTDNTEILMLTFLTVCLDWNVLLSETCTHVYLCRVHQRLQQESEQTRLIGSLAHEKAERLRRERRHVISVRFMEQRRKQSKQTRTLFKNFVRILSVIRTCIE